MLATAKDAARENAELHALIAELRIVTHWSGIFTPQQRSICPNGPCSGWRRQTGWFVAYTRCVQRRMPRSTSDVQRSCGVAGVVTALLCRQVITTGMVSFIIMPLVPYFLASLVPLHIPLLFWHGFRYDLFWSPILFISWSLYDACIADLL